MPGNLYTVSQDCKGARSKAIVLIWKSKNFNYNKFLLLKASNMVSQISGGRKMDSFIVSATTFVYKSKE